MKLRAAFALLLSLVFAISARASSDASPTPSLLDKTLEVLHLKHAPKAKDAPVLHHGLELKLDLSPNPAELSKDRQIKVNVSLYNRSKKFIHLDFPTTQRIEILVKDGSGKAVTTWSEDQSFTNDAAAVTINPGERLEYDASVATREMAGGQPYFIEASFPSYPELTAQERVVPEK